MEPINYDRSMYAVHDERVLLKKILETNLPDELPIEPKFLLTIIEDIFNCPSPITDGSDVLAEQAQTRAFENMTYPQPSSNDMLEALVILIERISCKIECKRYSGGDAQIDNILLGGYLETAFSILGMVAKYSWGGKLVLILSAFAVNCGVFLLVAQSYTSNRLAKSVAILKQLPEILDEPSVLKSEFDRIKHLIKDMMDITKCIIEIYELQQEYRTRTLTDKIAFAVYWTIQSVLVFASRIGSISGLRVDLTASTTETSELNSLSERLRDIRSDLSTELDASLKRKRQMELIQGYQDLVNLLDVIHIDNMKVLNVLINPYGYLQPLHNGSTKITKLALFEIISDKNQELEFHLREIERSYKLVNTVTIDVLRKKHVLLLISDLDILQEELSILEHIYKDSRLHPTWMASQYEVVWLPILFPAVPWTESENKQFKNLQAKMTWYTVHDPSLIGPAVINFIKEKWNFHRKPILVALDPYGQVVCPNALPMMWIWQNTAYPFTISREEALWKEQIWSLDFLVNNIDQLILNWISEGRFVCLYGGEDIDWIRNFTITTRNVAEAAGISLEMVYVGKSNPKEPILRNIVTIKAEKLSHCLQDLTSVWYFWVRIFSMWQSRHQLARNQPEKTSELLENNYITREIMTMMSFGGSEEAWALLSKGSAEMTRGNGNKFLTCISEYNLWKNNVKQKGFFQELKDHLLQLHTPDHCNQLVIPANAGLIPEKVLCSECGRTMENFFMYQCCDE